LSKGAFEQLYAFSQGQLPSRRVRPKSPSASGQKPALALMPQGGGGAPDAGNLPELERELAQSREVEKLQFEQDGLAQKIFDTEQKLKGTEGLRAAYDEAEAAYKTADTPAKYGLPPDIVEKAQQYPQLLARRDAQLAKLDAEGNGPVEPAPTPRSVPPLTQDRNFLLAMAGGVAMLALGMFLHGAARYVALLDLPAFGFAALLAWRWVDELEQAQHSTRVGGMRAAREKKIRDEFEREAGYVKAAMLSLGVNTPEELVDAFAKKAMLKEKMEEYRQQLAAYEADPEYAEASRALAKLREQHEAINAKLTEKGSFIRDSRTIEMEISRAREALRGQAAVPAPQAPQAAATGEKLEDPCPALLAVAADLLQTDVATLGPAVKDRAAQYLAAFSDRRFAGVSFDPYGKAAVGQGTARLPVSDLPARDADIVYLSLRFTLVEKVSSKVKYPFLVEEGLPIDDAKAGLLGRMLRHIGTMTQVLHASANPAYAGAADLTANL
jgi:hypothetical protein